MGLIDLHKYLTIQTLMINNNGIKLIKSSFNTYIATINILYTIVFSYDKV